ncbi:MAG: DUF1553 domain-containing protein [Pirellulaceae bacterium]|nr:DUF1553 domain-containing protein [Pirellulaceae bacterium]
MIWNLIPANVRRVSRVAGLWLVAASWLGLVAGPAASAEPEAPPNAALFEQKIRPLLARHCLKCHGEEKQESDLRLDTWEGMASGGVSGPAVVPGEPGQSLLMTAISYQEDDLQMPPDRKLSDEELALFRRWIEAGAPHPDARGAASPAASSRYRIDLEQARRFWSFVPPRMPDLPAVTDTTWPANELDHFILAELERAGLRPSPAATRGTWLRRVTFDLTGLPPTPEELAAFEDDQRADAYERAVDRLLASPHYGVRWGRHWLDVARYSDSNGLDENIAHGNAWRYRDYVIAAWNQDKPYDRFLAEQLAGDQLPAASDAERRDQATATGFLSLGPKVLAEVDETKMEMDIIDEQISTLGTAVLGLTFGCARCHDHKFDPITMRDYYALAGIFKSTRTMEHFRKIARWNEVSIASSDQQQQADEHQRRVAAQEQAIQQLVADANQQLLKSAEPGATVPKDAEAKYPEETRSQLKALRDELKLLQSQAPQLPTAMGVCDREISNVPIHVRGSHLTLGEVIPRGFPQVLADDEPVELAEQTSGRRELAEWLTDPGHPLTSRVIVNRVWRWHFGQGICRSTDNLGQLGTRPTHPELLDWLAVRFQRDGWSLKQLHRLIVLSSTYRTSSLAEPLARQKDPDNRLLARFPLRRLEAEAIRDALLFVSGKLDQRLGGSLLHVGNREFFFDHTSKDGTKYDSRQRSVYLPVVRNNLYDVFQLFDFADASVSNGDRSSTTIAPQALFMMNSPLVIEASAALADRLLSGEELSDDQRVEQLYRLAYGRGATAEEREQFAAELTQLIDLVREEAGEDKMPEAAARRQAWQVMCQAVLAANEFIYLR